MPKTHLAAVRRHTEQAAENWPKNRPITNKLRTFERYNAASDRLISDIVRSEPITGNELLPSPSRFGIRMMFRTCYIASLVADRESMLADDLSAALTKPESFEVLRALQLTSARVAERMEDHMGLTPSDRGIMNHRLDDWLLTDGVLTFRDIERHISLAKERVPTSKTEGECPLHAAKLNQPIFSAIVRICSRDQNLFPRKP